MTDTVIVSIDQGTTSSRTLVFSPGGDILFTAQQEFPQIYPQDGWVEHDPEAIWNSTLSTMRDAVAFTKKNKQRVLGIGITNQRETTIVWDRKTGKPIYNAIVWQDRRTAQTCRDLGGKYDVRTLSAKTGLILDPYFSATKIAWILDNVKGARKRAEAGELAFGTVDSFLIWRLTGGAVHATDATNASRTNIFNIHSQSWDTELLSLFDVPASVLPDVKDCADNYGMTDKAITGVNAPILGVAGDQQAAAIGQACFTSGSVKSTYGTGCFVILNTGETCVSSTAKLLSTVAYRLNGQTTYALEGSIFVAGAAIQWLRDGLRIIEHSSESENLIESLPGNQGVYMVPAFTGLGAPHWDPDARGAIFGLTRDTGRAHFVRAAVESVVYQTSDLLGAMASDGAKLTSLRVDGGMTHNKWMVQYLANVLDLPIERPMIVETTALGVAFLVGLQCGLYKDLDAISKQWNRKDAFTPSMDTHERKSRLTEWHGYVQKVLSQ
ncbi:glycerol kinase GlpK [Fretibacter rubidus]|uniref:glycerol kinase GlpK n=1 Tax=Fretibacter rubidus TaxID=570162 RepID=UPI00352B64BA